MYIVVEAPCLDVVLGQLGVGQQRDIVRDQLHIHLGKLLQLQVYSADLNTQETVMDTNVFFLEEILPVYQKDNSGVSTCNETFCCRSDSS